MADGYNVSAPAGDTSSSGDINDRSAGKLERRLLKRAQEMMVFERFGQVKRLPKHSTKTIKWRRYESLAPAMTALTEGVTPDGVMLKYTDLSVTLKQYGSIIRITDVIQDTHEDPVLQEAADLAGEQAADTIEYLRYGTLRAGSNVIYAGGVASRALLTTTIAKDDLRLAYRTLRRHRAKPITRIVSATDKVDTTPVGASYFAVCHPDIEADLRDLTGFTPVEQYSDSSAAVSGEVGKWENFRFVTTTYAEPITETGVNSGGFPVDTAGTMDDTGAGAATGSIVYPILVFGRDAYGIVPLQGYESVRISVMDPNKITKDDMLGQRGGVGWKTWNGTKILNDSFMLRLEVLADDLGTDAWDDYYGNDADTPVVGDDQLVGTEISHPTA